MKLTYTVTVTTPDADTDAGEVALAMADALDSVESAHPDWKISPFELVIPELDPFRPADNVTECPRCGDEFSWNDEDGLAGQTCLCGHVFS